MVGTKQSRYECSAKSCHVVLLSLVNEGYAIKPEASADPPLGLYEIRQTGMERFAVADRSCHCFSYYCCSLFDRCDFQYFVGNAESQ